MIIARFRKFKRRLSPFTLEQFDENSVCVNALKKLSASKETANALGGSSGQFMLHDWLYEKREIKSNLELTKSLKLIGPVLYDTLQKKYVTSNMWELFTGPLTWQHFCRLAFRDTSSKQASLHHHHHASSLSAGSSASHHGVHQNQNAANQNQNCEPEPIPALLVSSVDKEWLTISPYAVKFWDKFNFEPYSKHKNIAYVVLMPEFSTSGTTTTNEAQTEMPPELDECEAVRDYFKELGSTYELCRLGLHRPALRIAPDHGFVRVPLAFSKQSASSSSTSTQASNNKNKIKVDPWFTQIQANR